MHVKALHTQLLNKNCFANLIAKHSRRIVFFVCLFYQLVILSTGQDNLTISQQRAQSQPPKGLSHPNDKRKTSVVMTKWPEHRSQLPL